MSLNIVHERKKYSISPTEIPSKMIMSNINSSQVPVLIIEEINNIYHME